MKSPEKSCGRELFNVFTHFFSNLFDYAFIMKCILWIALWEFVTQRSSCL